MVIQPGEGRVMTVFIAQGWMRWPLRCRAGEFADYGWNVREPRAEGDQTPARMPCGARKREAGSGGRFKCMSGRQSVRTRRRVDKSDNSWGHAADRSNPSACGTLAKNFVSGPVQLSNELDHRPCAISMRDARIVTVRAPRARFLAQSFRTPPWGEGTETSRQALGPE